MEIFGKKNQVILMTSIICLVSAVFISCITAKGIPFQEIKDIPADKALIYFYQPAKAGASIVAVKKNNETILKKLIPGGYFPYFCDPGSYTIEAGLFIPGSRADVKITFQVEAGKSHYLRYEYTNALLISMWELKPVEPGTAITEIIKCNLLSD